jgi:phosphoglycolate phosphatase-like HAD superfamily hydrolase
MLILFDIDRTLLETDAAGMACLLDAGRSLFGPSFTIDGVPFGGRLDPLIIRDILAASGVEHTPERALAMRRGYHERMTRLMARPGSAKALPGTAELVRTLASVQTLTLGLLTGNFEETGRLKLGAAGFDTDGFPIRVWGDDSPFDPPAREHLPPVGIDRYTAVKGVRPVAEDVLIIGDTIHDVACGLAHGCRVLGVATGHDSADTLARAGAHRVVENLSDTQGITAWITRSNLTPT